MPIETVDAQFGRYEDFPERTIAIGADETLDLAFVWKDDATAIDITGGYVTAWIVLPDGSHMQLPSDIADGTGGLQKVLQPPYKFAPGLHRIAVRLTLNDRTMSAGCFIDFAAAVGTLIAPPVVIAQLAPVAAVQGADAITRDAATAIRGATEWSVTGTATVSSTGLVTIPTTAPISATLVVTGRNVAGPTSVPLPVEITAAAESATAPDTMAAPTLTGGETQITITPPAAPDLNGGTLLTDGYRFLVYSAADALLATINRGNLAEFDVTGLSAQTGVYATVFARTNAGNGTASAASNTVAVTPAATAPDAFLTNGWALADQPSTDGDTLTLTISALPVDNGGAAITSIEYRIGTGAAVTLASGAATGARDITVLADTEASITVRAVNSVGAGPWSDAKTATPTEIITVTAVPFSGTTRTGSGPGNGQANNAEFVTPKSVRMSNGDVYAALYSSNEGDNGITGGVIIRHMVCPTSDTLDADVFLGWTARNNHSDPALIMRSDGKAMVIWTGHSLRYMRMRVQTTAGDWANWDAVVELGPSLFPNDDPIPTMTYVNAVNLSGATTPTIYIFFRGAGSVDGRLYYTSSTDDGDTWSAATQVCDSAQRLYPVSAVNAAGTEATMTVAYHPLDSTGNAGQPIWGFNIDNAGQFRSLTGTAITPSATLALSDLTEIADEGILPVWNFSLRYDGAVAYLLYLVYVEDALADGDMTLKRATILANGTVSTEIVGNLGAGEGINRVGAAITMSNGSPDVVYAGFSDSTVATSRLLGVYQRRTDGTSWRRTVIGEGEIDITGLRVMETSNDEPVLLVSQLPGPFGMIVQYPNSEDGWLVQEYSSMHNGQAVAYTPNPSRWAPTVSTAAQAVVDLEFDTVLDATQVASTFDSANMRALDNGDSVGVLRTLTAGTNPFVNRVDAAARHSRLALTADGVVKHANGVSFDGAAGSYLLCRQGALGPNWMTAVRFSPTNIGTDFIQLIAADIPPRRIIQFRVNSTGVQAIAFNTSDANFGALATKTIVNGGDYCAIAYLNGTAVHVEVIDMADTAPRTPVTGTGTLTGSGRLTTANMPVAIGANLNTVDGSGRFEGVIRKAAFKRETAPVADIAAVRTWLQE